MPKVNTSKVERTWVPALIDEIIDDWDLLKHAKLTTRYDAGYLLSSHYSPPHVTVDVQSPLWWRKQALRNKWSGVVVDSEPMNGNALLGLASIPSITYTTFIPNKRHEEHFLRMARVLGIKVQFLESRAALDTLTAQKIR